jgi:hypothetical protein
VQAGTPASAVNYGRREPTVVVEASEGLYFMFCIPALLVIMLLPDINDCFTTCHKLASSYDIAISTPVVVSLSCPYYECRIYVQISGLCHY